MLWNYNNQNKKHFCGYYRHVNIINRFVEGSGVIVEVDETVLWRRGVIRDPIFRDDDEVRDTVWIVGIIEKYNKSAQGSQPY